MAERPSVSIITPCLNSVATIAAAIESVRAQAADTKIEHLVLDGGSTDGTLDVLAEFPGIQVFSGPDKNLYDAINKGIQRSSGDIIGLLNADDTYRPDAMSRALKAFRNAPEADMASGGAEIVTGQGGVVARHVAAENRSLRFGDLLLGVPIINARFIRRRLLERLEGFDVRFPVAADRDLLFRAALTGAISVPVEGVVYTYCQHAGSLTIGGDGARLRIADDHMILAERWLSDRSANLPDDARAALLRLHAHGVLIRGGAALRDGDTRAMVAVLRRGLAVDPRWFIAALAFGLRKLAARTVRLFSKR